MADTIEALGAVGRSSSCLKSSGSENKTYVPTRDPTVRQQQPFCTATVALLQQCIFQSKQYIAETLPFIELGFVCVNTVRVAAPEDNWHGQNHREV